MAFRKAGLGFPQAQSKYEQFGETLRERLEEFHRQGKRHVHWYQLEALRAAKSVLEKDWETGDLQPTLIVAPTGAGKTGIITLLPYFIQAKKVLVLTPGLVISEQIKNSFGGNKNEKSFFEKCGLFDSKERLDMHELENILEPVRIIANPSEIKDATNQGNLIIVNAQKFGGSASTSLTKKMNKKGSHSRVKRSKTSAGIEEAQYTLCHRTANKENPVINDVREFFSKFDLLIVDEAHHYPAETWLRIKEVFVGSQNLVRMKKKSIVFFTATPERLLPNGKVGCILDKQRIAYKIEPKDCLGVSTRYVTFQDVERVANAVEHLQLYENIKKILDAEIAKYMQRRTQKMENLQLQ